MPKSVATPIVRYPMPIGRICAVLSALALLPAAGAATPEPALRRSEQLDIRRLGKVSDDERSVLRIEWRVGLTGVDEARSVQDMLDNLRRIEQSMSAISLLVRDMPARKQIAMPTAAEPEVSADNGTRLMVANLAAACLVALWWFRRRKSAKPSVPKTAGALKEGPFVAVPPTMTPSTATGAHRVQTAPIAPDAAIVPEVPEVPEVPDVPPRIEPRVSTETIEVASEPTPGAPPTAEPGASPTSDADAPSAPLPAAESAIVNFSLEEDPEGEARAKARIPVPRSKDRDPRVPERRQEIDVEPTLQLAEIMLSMGLEQGAAQTLIEYTEANPRGALHHWLKLLGIYRKRGLHQEFRAAAENLRKNFNIQAQYLQKSHTGEMPTLENFSRVAEHVQEIWSRPNECIDYLGRLLEDNRDGERAGFPQAVAEEILLLIEMLKDMSGSSQKAGT
jgi:hypothetical protein